VISPADVARSDDHPRFDFLLNRCKGMPRLPMAIIHPCDALSLEGALAARAAGLIEPWLFGPVRRIALLAETLGLDLSSVVIRDVPDARAAIVAAAAAARRGEIGALMKGDVHTDDFLHGVLDRELGFRRDRRISHAFAIDTPAYSHPLIVSDGAIHIQPGLEEKREICQNAIDLARAIGIEQRRVAVLAAVETVHASMPATVHAAALSVMGRRGQIVGAEVDGPLALDNAISPASVQAKHLDHRVGGRANILIVPDLESGNILVKTLTLMSRGIAAGIVLGASLPIALTSRADTRAARVASAALAVLTADMPSLRE